MALITRVSRLFKADFHAVLDRIEEPDVLLKHAVREMEEDLARDEQRMKWLRHEAGQLNQRSDEISQVLARIEEELDVCFAADKQDLAKTTIKRKLENDRRQKLLHTQQQVNEKEIQLLDERLQENRQQLEQFRQKAEVLTEDQYAAVPPDYAEPGVQDEDVEIAFLREVQRRETSQRGAS